MFICVFLSAGAPRVYPMVSEDELTTFPSTISSTTVITLVLEVFVLVFWVGAVELEMVTLQERERQTPQSGFYSYNAFS